MDKYLLVILVFMIAGMGIAITRVPPLYLMFYSMLGGAIVIIIYSSYKERQARRAERDARRKR